MTISPEIALNRAAIQARYRRRRAAERQRSSDADKLPLTFKVALRRLLRATDVQLHNGRYKAPNWQTTVISIRTARQMYQAKLLKFIVDNGCSRIELTVRGRQLAAALDASPTIAAVAEGS